MSDELARWLFEQDEQVRQQLTMSRKRLPWEQIGPAQGYYRELARRVEEYFRQAGDSHEQRAG